MHPTLLAFGSIIITTYGFFLFIAVAMSLYVMWRLANLYDLNREKLIDLFLIGLLFGLVGGRLIFVLTHLSSFTDLLTIFQLNTTPGLSLWGTVLGLILAVSLFSKRFHFIFWQLADFGMVALFMGLIWGHIGCLLGSCEYGLPVNAWFGIPQSGVIDRRFPIQIIAAAWSYILFVYFWKKAMKFHVNGSIASFGLVWLGISTAVIDLGRADIPTIWGPFSINIIGSVLAVLIGLILYYRLTKRSLKNDFKDTASLMTHPSQQISLLTRWRKAWYTLIISSVSILNRWIKAFSRKFNVRSNPKKF